MGRIDQALRDLILEMLLVREGEVLTPAIARDRAANIAMALTGNFRIERLPGDFPARPDSNDDDHRIT